MHPIRNNRSNLENADHDVSLILLAPSDLIPAIVQREEQTLLQREDYTSKFGFKAEELLKETPSIIPLRGKSIAVDVHKELDIKPKLLGDHSAQMPGLWRRLLTKETFKCIEIKNGTSLGRVYVRGVASMVPVTSDTPFRLYNISAYPIYTLFDPSDFVWHVHGTLPDSYMLYDITVTRKKKIQCSR